MLSLKLETHVMLTPDGNIKERLVSGQMGTIKYLNCTNANISVISVHLDDVPAGKILMYLDNFAKRNHIVPTIKVELTFKLKPNSSDSPTIQTHQCFVGLVQFKRYRN